MVGAEGPGRSSPGDGLHHRRLHLDVAARIEKAPERLEHLRALDEDRAHIGVHEQVDVTLPVAQFHVGQAVILLGQGQHRLGEKGDGIDMHRELAGAGAEDVAGDPDVISQVEQFIELETLSLRQRPDERRFAAAHRPAAAGQSRLYPGRGWP